MKLRVSAGKRAVVIISHDLRVVFIHVPKCAGTALRKVFQSESSPGGSVSLFDFAYSHVLRRYVDLAQLPLMDFRHFPEWRYLKRYRTVACIRNPYSRLASACREYYRQLSRETQQQMLHEPPSAEQVRAYLAALPAALEAHDLRFVHGFPATWFTHYSKKPMVDYLLRMECLEEDLLGLAGQSEFPSALGQALLAEVRRGSRRASASLASLESDSDLIGMANLLHREDFSTFGYPRKSAECKVEQLKQYTDQSVLPAQSHTIPITSMAPALRWYWGRSCNMVTPPMRPTR